MYHFSGDQEVGWKVCLTTAKTAIDRGRAWGVRQIGRRERSFVRKVGAPFAIVVVQRDGHAISDVRPSAKIIQDRKSCGAWR
ncbi:hypothetical protein CKO51_04260 [Rhodopirellula sp. SM50]|nr:hypothetical protein CKO51_04260 [Rhodopirellula sp. SM50]